VALLVGSALIPAGPVNPVGAVAVVSAWP